MFLLPWVCSKYQSMFLDIYDIWTFHFVGHYVENTGNTTLRYLEISNSGMNYFFW